MGLHTAGVAGKGEASDDPLAEHAAVILLPYAASSRHLRPYVPPSTQLCCLLLEFLPSLIGRGYTSPGV